MSTVIRLARLGKRGMPIYRIVAIDKRARRDSSPREVLGSYIPAPVKNQIGKVALDKTRLTYWQSQGALVSPAVQKLLSQKEVS